MIFVKNNIFMKNFSTTLLFPFVLCITIAHSQNNTPDSIKFNYRKIYSLCLDGNVKSALALIELEDKKKLSTTEVKFKTEFENRFKYDVDQSSFMTKEKAPIDSLLLIFREYWRKSVLNIENNYDTFFIRDYHNFLKEKFPHASEKEIREDSKDLFLTKYLKSKKLYTTDGIGKTGRLYDLLVWKNQKDTIYSFKIDHEKIHAKVVFMDDFITLGWEEYTTLGKYYPGGWATKDALFCVKKAYDLNSEDFLISYLAHESRHFSDYKLFPKLSSSDLEYRAKLTELSLAKKTIYELIEFFISNANYNSNNGHSVANFCIIKDLSKVIFDVEFEKDVNKWKAISKKKINKMASEILQSNTKSLQLKGTDIEKFIKP